MAIAKRGRIMKQVFNPFLPLDEYIPDGEPHVFGDRIYLYGSHEEAGGDTFCSLDYVAYSAPVEDLTNWRNEGYIFKAKQNPHYSEELKYMYAPDCVCGNDGRFYLYYCPAGYRGKNGYNNPIYVAVSDSPAGPCEYYGFVKNPDGSVFNDYVTFDPAVLNDDGKIRLYYGTYMKSQDDNTLKNTAELYAKIAQSYKKSLAEVEAAEGYIDGPCTVELEDDMLTVKGRAKRVLARRTEGTEYYDHAFYEAPSVRKIGDTYYFIYSSVKNNELCYCTSTLPDGGFTYRGVIISNGDVGYKGRRDEDRLAYTGTNHGSIENINGKWYVFYHRLTHKRGYSRQACAERIEILPDGSIPQVEITSCGLNGAPLIAEGRYSSAICCNLTNGRMPNAANRISELDVPFIIQKDGMQFVTEIGNNTVIGFKYFNFTGKTLLYLTVRGGEGKFEVITDTTLQDEVLLLPSDEWHCVKAEIVFTGKAALYLKFSGEGKAELGDIIFKSSI